MENIDLIIDRIGQLCMIPAHDGGPQRGQNLGDLAILEDAALAIHEGRIAGIGERESILESYEATDLIDAQGRLVTPGLVDPHTHLIWAGDRVEEFEMRLAGATYQEIMAAGGGINQTVAATRAASMNALVEQAKGRLDRMLRLGTTTVEAKTGYGLDLDTEIKLLNVIALLDTEHQIELVPTFLGAHAIPPEYSDNPDGYVQLLVETIIPAVATWQSEHWPGPLYCDAFCEEGAFSVDQTRRIFDAAKMAGMPLKLHADEFTSLGGVALAIEMGAESIDHLLATTPEDVQLLGESETIAVLLPATAFGLGMENTSPARALIDAGAALALATDCNPGTAWCESMQLVLALATRSLGLNPAQALAAATINAAYAIGRGDQIGSVELGKQADFVVWDVPDYRHLSYRFGTNMAWRVIKNGQLIK